MALGATWNPALVEQVGGGPAEETKAKGARPAGLTVNIHRSPIAGRNFECYAEDPTSGMMASVYIRGLCQVWRPVLGISATSRNLSVFQMSSRWRNQPLHVSTRSSALFLPQMAAQPLELDELLHRVNVAFMPAKTTCSRTCSRMAGLLTACG